MLQIVVMCSVCQLYAVLTVNRMLQQSESEFICSIQAICNESHLAFAYIWRCLFLVLTLSLALLLGVCDLLFEFLHL